MSTLAERLMSFVVERYPFALPAVRRALESCDLSREVLSLSCERFTFSGKLLLRFRPRGCGCSLGRFGERTPVFVCNYTQNVRCRCAQIGFELSAEADAEPVERRTDAVVERR